MQKSEDRGSRHEDKDPAHAKTQMAQSQTVRSPESRVKERRSHPDGEIINREIVKSGQNGKTARLQSGKRAGGKCVLRWCVYVETPDEPEPTFLVSAIGSEMRGAKKGANYQAEIPLRMRARTVTKL